MLLAKKQWTDTDQDFRNMQKKVDELKETLKAFVDQRDFFVMVINAADQEMVLLLKILQGIEQESQTDIFLMFSGEMSSLSDYISTIVASLRTQINDANKVRQEESLPEWPTLPPVCSDSTQMPETRLRAVMDHVRSFFPLENDNRLVWGFLPFTVSNPSDYQKLISFLAPITGFEPWMRGHRILLRDDRENPFLAERLSQENIKGLVIYDIDLSPEAMSNALVEDAQDPDLPAPDRMQALMQLAALDFAHKRYDQAIEKYGVLYNYYQEQDLPAMQALCLAGHGDVLRQKNQIEAAKARYQQAIAHAVSAQSLPVMLNLFQATGDCCLELTQYEEAEGYFDFSNQAAGKTFNIYAKCDAMEKLGMAQEKQEKHESALDIWRKGLSLSKEYDYWIRAKSILERLTESSKAQGLDEEHQAYLAELSEIKKQVNQ